MAKRAKQSPQAVCLLGGTFDPPHRAHLALAMAVRRQFGFKRVAFLPAAVPPLKDREVTPARHRIAMLRLAIKGKRGLAIDTRELERAKRSGRPSYTVDTVREVLRELGDGSSVAFVIGADQLVRLHKWRMAKWLVRHVRFIVALRPPFDASVFRQVERTLGREAALRLEADSIRLKPMDVSSTRIRERAHAGKSLRGLVAPAVAAYITKHGLYE